MRPLSIVTCGLILAASAAVASAETIKVKPGLGTPLADAVAQLQDGDKLLISKGEYSESLVFSGLNDITIVGKGLVKVLGTGTASTIFLNACTNISIRRLTIGRTDKDGLSIAGSSNITVNKVTVNEAAASAFRVTGSTDVTLKSCVALGDAEQDGLHVGVNVSGVERLEIQRCRFGDGLDRGISMNTSDAAPDIDVGIRKCRFDGQSIQAMLVGGINLVCEKNRFTNCSSGIRTSGTGDFSMLIQKNRFRDTDFLGVTIQNPNVTVNRNSFRDSGSLAISASVNGPDPVITDNKIRNHVDGGMAVSGIRAVVTGNKITGIKGPSSRGLFAKADDALYEKNRVTNTEGTGLDITKGGGIFRGNTVKKSGVVDVKSLVSEASNTFENNTFGSVSFP